MRLYLKGDYTKEIPFMDDVRDPVWEEDERRNEEYIKIHVEPVYDDEEQ